MCDFDQGLSKGRVLFNSAVNSCICLVFVWTGV